MVSRRDRQGSGSERSHWQNMPEAADKLRKEVLQTMGESKHFRNPVRMTGFGDDFASAARGGAGGDDFTHTERTRVHQPRAESGWPNSQRNREHEVMFGIDTEMSRKGRPIK